MSRETQEERKDIATQEAADLGPIIGIKEKTKRDEEIQKGLQEPDKIAKLTWLTCLYARMGQRLILCIFLSAV